MGLGRKGGANALAHELPDLLGMMLDLAKRCKRKIKRK
jgi:hypothetical protein